MNVINVTGAEYIIGFLSANGYDRVFGIPGRRILPLFDAALRDGRVEMVVTQHEEGAAFMADCYSRINGKGCCIGISGPGAINLLNGVASAFADSQPMLVFAGQAQVANQGRYAIQEATGLGRTPDQFKMMDAVTKFSCKISHITELPTKLENAFIEAHTGRKGPVYIELPTDILDEKLTLACSISPVILPEIKRKEISSDQLDEIIALLSQAKAPLLLLGNGVVLSGATREAQKLIDTSKIPFASTLLGKGIVNEDQFGCLGCIGIWGQKSGNEYILNHSDLIIAVGTTFQELSTLGWRTLENKKIIRVDIDPGELTRNVTPEVAIENDARYFLQVLSEYLPKCGKVIDFSGAQRFAEELKGTYGYYETLCLDEYPVPKNNKIQPYDALISISKTRPKDAVLVMDVGENAYFAEFLVKSFQPKTYLQNAGLGSMGFSVAGSIGASFATKDQQVISITGDSGFLMNCNELATAAQYNQKVIWCVFNNSVRGTQKHYQRDFCDGRYVGADMPKVDMVGLSVSLGIKAVRVETLEQLQNAVLDAVEVSESVLIDIIIDEDTKPLPPFMF